MTFSLWRAGAKNERRLWSIGGQRQSRVGQHGQVVGHIGIQRRAGIALVEMPEQRGVGGRVVHVLAG